jgi:hypothetical protein
MALSASSLIGGAGVAASGPVPAPGVPLRSLVLMEDVHANIVEHGQCVVGEHSQ